MRRIVSLSLLALLLVAVLPSRHNVAQASDFGQFARDEVIVTFEDGYHISGNGAFFKGSAVQKKGLGIGPIHGVEALSPDSRVALLTLPEGSDMAATLATLSKQPGVRFAERNALRQATVVPNDPIYGQQWGMTKIGAEGAWDITTGAPLVIAIIDTGVSSSHPDLAGRVLSGYNAIANNTNAEDDEGHGTAMAGIAAAAGNNGQGVAGLCWACQILPVKVLNSRGSGSAASVVRGLYWAADNGARIISMSLGGDEKTQAEEDVINYIYSKNIPIFAASGNAGNDGNPTIYPAAFPHVIAVGATAPNDTVSGFSSYGSYVDVAAPGVGIWTTAWDNGQNTYGSGNGTSPACPAVSGTAALALSLWPELTVDQLEQLIEGSAVDIMDPGKDVKSGFGRVDTLKTVQNAAARNLPGAVPNPPPPPPPVANPAFTPVGAPPLPAVDGEIYFPETGHNLRGEFRNYWMRNGGLAVFGYPLSEEFTEQTPEGAFVVQYFERQRFEFHAEKPAPYNVLLGRLGDAVLRDRGDDWFTFPKGSPQANCQFFSETGHTVCGAFLEYWQNNGLADPSLTRYERSLQLFGFPLSEERTETNANGDTVTTQWFERGRFEYHDGKGVLLGLLAKEYSTNRGWR
jgi:thermitase